MRMAIRLVVVMIVVWEVTFDVFVWVVVRVVVLTGIRRSVLMWRRTVAHSRHPHGRYSTGGHTHPGRIVTVAPSCVRVGTCMPPGGTASACVYSAVVSRDSLPRLRPTGTRSDARSQRPTGPTLRETAARCADREIRQHEADRGIRSPSPTCRPRRRSVNSLPARLGGTPAAAGSHELRR